MRRNCTRFLFGALCGSAVAIFLVASGEVAVANHYKSPAHLTADLHEGQYDADYTVCTSDATTSAQWSSGAEVWEQAMVERIRLHKTSSQCSGADTTRIIFMWEYGALQCPQGAIACHLFYQALPYAFQHTTSFTHWHVNTTYIAFNQAQYGGLASDAWRDAVSAHEMGHTFSIADHGGNQCTAPFQLMSQVPAFPEPTFPCIQAPNHDELCSAWDRYSYDGNADANFIDLPPSKVYDDTTMVHSDNAEDGCDDDADNDGLTNAAERYTPCPSSSGPTNQRVRDTDGDRVLDGAECWYGTNPNSAASVPGVGGTDSDGDSLNNVLETYLGSNPNDVDSDDDKLSDGVEYRGYNSDPTMANTDGDVCADGKEVASIDADTTVDVVDMQQVAAHQSNSPNPPYHANFDYNKNGQINVADIQQVAAQQGSC